MGRKRRTEEENQHPDYDPFEIPADVTKAEEHFLATRIARPLKSAKSLTAAQLGDTESGKAERVDPASLLPIANELIPLCCATEELSFLAPGYPMYYQYVKFCIYVGLCIFTFSGIYNLYTSYYGTSCTLPEKVPPNLSQKEMTKLCVKNFITELSLANKVDDAIVLEKQEIYNFFTILILLLLFQFMRKIQQETALICDERDVTASDFALRIRDFPTDFDDSVDIDDVVGNFFREKGLPGQRLKIENVSCCYDCTEKLQIQEKLEKLSIKKTKYNLKASKHGREATQQKLIRIHQEMEELKEKLIEISKIFEEGVGMASKFTGEAYIVLETEEDVEKVLKFWTLGWYRKLRETYKQHSPFKFRGQLITVEKAPEPSNVNWANSGVSNETKRKRRTITFLASAAILLLSAKVIVVIYERKEEIAQTLLDGDKSDDAHNQVMLTIVSSLASIVIVVINSILKVLLEYFSEYEAYSTMAEQQSSYSFKLAVSQFLNTSIVTLAVSLWAGNLWGPGGLVESIYGIFYFNAIIPWFTEFLDAGYWVIVYERYKMRRDGPRILKCQKDLNKAFENPPFDFATKYAVYTKTITSAAFFAPLCPMAMVWAVIGLVGSYWIDKYLMLRRRGRLYAVGPELSFEFVEYLEFTLILFSAGNFFFYKELSSFTNRQLMLSIAGFTIGCLNAALPMEEVNQWIFPSRDLRLNDQKYWEVKLFLPEDYDRANPATAELAKLKFLTAKNAPIKK